MYPIIDVKATNQLPDRQLLDCRFDLMNPQAGYEQYLQGHLPGARYANLDLDLATLGAGSGRHPLPSDQAFSETLSRLGIRVDAPVVVYDGAGGALAARAWWMLSACGLECAVLDGGIGAWTAAGLPLSQGQEDIEPTLVAVELDRSGVVAADQLAADLEAGTVMLMDARAANRFRGEVEPIDPVAGHVPGAENRPFSDNLLDGRFKAQAELADEWGSVLGGRLPEQVVHMCGSGVTACTNLLAMEAAGLSGSRLYVDSWSGWIAENRPIAAD